MEPGAWKGNPMNENRGSWYLLTGVILGIGLGLLVSWVLWPTRYRDNAPSSLSDEYKDRYRALIAAAYMASGDIDRARSRLKLLEDPDSAAALITQAQRSMVAGHPDAEVQALSLLGLTLASGNGQTPNVTFPPTLTPLSTPTSQATATPTNTVIPSPVVAWTLTPANTVDSASLFATSLLSTGALPSVQAGTPTPPTHTPTPPLPTFTLAPTLTPTPTITPGQPFRLAQKQIVCNPDLAQPLIQVQVHNAAGSPLAGVEGFVFWDGGSDRFITGLKPEMGQGYADFIMKQNVVYTIQLVNGEPVRDLSVQECTNASGSQYPGGWLLVFEQP
jgi:hypothetical protein